MMLECERLSIEDSEMLSIIINTTTATATPMTTIIILITVIIIILLNHNYNTQHHSNSTDHSRFLKLSYHKIQCLLKITTCEICMGLRTKLN